MNEISKSTNHLFYKIWVIVFSLCYGIFLSGLPVDALMDRDSYLNYVEDSQLILALNFSQGFLKTLSNEPLWLILNWILFLFLHSSEGVLKTYIFISSTLFAYMVLARGPKNGIWLIFFLFVPQVLKNYIIHLRQGVAISIFFTAYYMRPGKWRNLLVCLSPFLHASFFFIVFLFFLRKIYSKYIHTNGMKIFISVCISFLVVAFLNIISQAVGARQAEEYDSAMAAGVSGAGFLLWMFVSFIFLTENKIFIDKYFFEISSLLFYLISYFFVEVSGRIFESIVIFVLIAGVNMSGLRRLVFLVVILLFSLISYIEKYNQPLWGFGA